MESLSTISAKKNYYPVNGSIGTLPGRVICGDMVDSDLAMDLPEGTNGSNPEDYFVKLRKTIKETDLWMGTAKFGSDQVCSWRLYSSDVS